MGSYIWDIFRFSVLEYLTAAYNRSRNSAFFNMTSLLAGSVSKSETLRRERFSQALWVRDDTRPLMCLSDLCIGTRSGIPLGWPMLLWQLTLLDTALEQDLKILNRSSQSCSLVWYVPRTSNHGGERKEGCFGRR